MKKSKNTLITILLTAFLLAIIVCFSIFTGFHDRKTVKFLNKHKAAEYIKSGWIPSNIPENAKNIILYYDVDTNEINGSFQSTQEYISKFKENLDKIEKEEFIHKKRIVYSKFKSITNRNVSFYKNESYFFIIEDHTIYFFSLDS